MCGELVLGAATEEAGDIFGKTWSDKIIFKRLFCLESILFSDLYELFENNEIANKDSKIIHKSTNLLSGHRVSRHGTQV